MHKNLQHLGYEKAQKTMTSLLEMFDKIGLQLFPYVLSCSVSSKKAPRWVDYISRRQSCQNTTQHQDMSKISLCAADGRNFHKISEILTEGGADFTAYGGNP